MTEEQQHKEIDLIALVRAVWRKKFKVILYGAIGFLFGIVVVIFTPKQYTSTCVFVAQTGSDASSDLANLGGLAMMAGLSGALPSRAQSVLSPKLYSKIVASTPFLKELMYTNINTKKSPVPVTLFDYLTKSEYQDLSFGKMIGSIMPKSKKPEGVDSLSLLGAKYDISVLTIKENGVAKALKSLISVDLDTQDNYIRVTVRMPEALVVAQVATTVVNMLQQYITHFKLERAWLKLDFIQERYDEIKVDYYKKLAEISQYRDMHRNQATEVARMQETKLSGEYDIAYALFTDVSKQLEQARIDVKKDTPLFTIVDPTTIPAYKSAPKRLVTIFLFTLLGGLIMAARVIFAEITRKEEQTVTRQIV